MKVEILKQVDKTWWNSLVASVPEGTIFQTSHWADFLAEYARHEPLYLVVKAESGEIKALLLLYKEASDALLTWQNGPVVFTSGEEKVDTCRFVLEEVRRLVKDLNGASIRRGNLPYYDPEIADKGAIPIDGYKMKKWATYLVDLTLDEEALRRNFKPAARKSVNRAERDGVYVERIENPEELYDYYLFTEECSRQTGRGGFPSFGNLSVMWEHLRPEQGVEIFVAKHNERKLCGLGIWAFNGIIYEFGSFQSDYSFEHKLYGNDLIKWEIIKWGHQKGYRIYDMAGVNPDPSSEKEANIGRFKEKWGGRYVEFGEYSKPLGNNLLGMLKKAKRKLWK
ncbi:lipid II:glycine glycyltransferase FemX [Chloroflexota bacterium]